MSIGKNFLNRVLLEKQDASKEDTKRVRNILHDSTDKLSTAIDDFFANLIGPNLVFKEVKKTNLPNKDKKQQFLTIEKQAELDLKKQGTTFAQLFSNVNDLISSVLQNPKNTGELKHPNNEQSLTSFIKNIFVQAQNQDQYADLNSAVTKLFNKVHSTETFKTQLETHCKGSSKLGTASRPEHKIACLLVLLGIPKSIFGFAGDSQQVKEDTNMVNASQQKEIYALDTPITDALKALFPKFMDVAEKAPNKTVLFKALHEDLNVQKRSMIQNWFKNQQKSIEKISSKE